VAERHEPVKYAKLTGSLFIPNTSGAVPPDRRCICASRQGIHYFSSRIEGIDSVIDVDVKYEVKPQQCQEILGIGAMRIEHARYQGSEGDDCSGILVLAWSDPRQGHSDG
jgi:hypothetical protein